MREDNSPAADQVVGKLKMPVSPVWVFLALVIRESRIAMPLYADTRTPEEGNTVP